MAWFAELAGRAEHLLNDLDDKAAKTLQSRQTPTKQDKSIMFSETWMAKQSKRPFTKPPPRKTVAEIKSNISPNRKLTRTKDTKSIDIAPAKPLQQVKQTSPKMSPRTNLLSEVMNAATNLKEEPSFEEEIEYQVGMHEYEPKLRRHSIAGSGEIQPQSKTDKYEKSTLVNNFKNSEVNMTNQEVNLLMERLKKLEQDSNIASGKIKELQAQNYAVTEEKNALMSEVKILKEKLMLQPHDAEIAKLKMDNETLEKDFNMVSERIKDLEEQITEMERQKQSFLSTQTKLENELHFSQVAERDLKNEIEKSKQETQKVQSDWDTYKLRVKAMLLGKDKEIRALLQKQDCSEGNTVLLDQIESLKAEHEVLVSTVERLKRSCSDNKTYVEQLETRSLTAERLVTALREALREERLAKNKADQEFNAICKELKSLQMESNNTISNLRSALRDKETELQRYRMNSVTCVSPSSGSSTLNVADYDRMHDIISTEKVQQLTQSLIAKQGRIDSLLADNNMLKIQMEKLESKYKAEISSLRPNQRVIQVGDNDVSTKSKLNRHHEGTSGINKISLRVGVFLRKHPVFRFLIVLYMAGLHLWVFVVLLTYTPEIHEA